MITYILILLAYKNLNSISYAKICNSSLKITWCCDKFSDLCGTYLLYGFIIGYIVILVPIFDSRFLFVSRDTFSTMWFIGLVFEKTENLNIDLTTDIQVFTAQGISIFP